MFNNGDRVKRAEPKLSDTPRNYEANPKDAKVPISPSTAQLRSDVLKPKNLVGTLISLKRISSFLFSISGNTSKISLYKQNCKTKCIF